MFPGNKTNTFLGNICYQVVNLSVVHVAAPPCHSSSGSKAVKSGAQSAPLLPPLVTANAPTQTDRYGAGNAASALQQLCRRKRIFPANRIFTSINTQFRSTASSPNIKCLKCGSFNSPINAYREPLPLEFVYSLKSVFITTTMLSAPRCFRGNTHTALLTLLHCCIMGATAH